MARKLAYKGHHEVQMVLNFEYFLPTSTQNFQSPNNQYEKIKNSLSGQVGQVLSVAVACALWNLPGAASEGKAGKGAIPDNS